MHKNIRWLLLILTLFISVFMIMGCQKTEKDQVIAEVNGAAITQKQFDQHYHMVLSYYRQSFGPIDENKDKDTIARLKESSYEDLVVQKLIWQEAERKNIKVDEKRVDEDIKFIREQKDKEEKDGYQKFLKENGFDEAFLRQEWTTQNLYLEVRDEVTKDLKVTDEEVRKAYEENAEAFKHPAGKQIYHILVETKEQANEVLGKLESGESFADTAAAYSLDPGSKSRGGDVGVVNQDTNFVEPFKQEALKLAPGQLLKEPVQTEFGYHIIKAGEQLSEGVWPLEKVQEDVRASLLQNKKDQSFNKFLEDLRSRAEIKDYRKGKTKS